MRAARAADAGQAAAVEHLGHGVGELAGKFLGPGDWHPGDPPAAPPAAGPAGVYSARGN